MRLLVLLLVLLLPRPAMALCICPECAFGHVRHYLMRSQEMTPTILPQDCIALRLRTADILLERGMIVGVQPPWRGPILIERIIALGGDRIALREGAVILNGVPLARSAALDYPLTWTPDTPVACPEGALRYGICHIRRWTEALPDGRSWQVLDLTDGARGDDMAELLVPPGHVFVMADHRDISIDSRLTVDWFGLGILPETAVVGTFHRFIQQRPRPE
jgi:signal peptidase I